MEIPSVLLTQLNKLLPISLLQMILQTGISLQILHVLPVIPAISGSDEGRAMLQIAHDIAPGAQLYFRSGFHTAGDFAKGIKELRDAGCKIIVDDITYSTEPFFKDGVVAKTVDEVKSAAGGGVSYFSSAGNFANKSYRGQFYPTILLTGKRSTILPEGINLKKLNFCQAIIHWYFNGWIISIH